jgi:hypothetical protein
LQRRAAGYGDQREDKGRALRRPRAVQAGRCREAHLRWGRGDSWKAAAHEEVIAVVSELKPDRVLLNLEIPGGSMGADESTRRMLKISPPKEVIFSMHDEPGMVRRR